MKEKFNPNKFLGKRKAFAVAGHPNIRRIYVWDKVKQRYVDPPRGNKFEARSSGKISGKREAGTFESLYEAHNWLNGTIMTQNSICPTGGLTVQDVIVQWQRLGWGHLSTSTKIYYGRMTPLLAPLYRVPIEELHPKHIDEWLILLKTPEWTRKYVSRRESLEKEFDMFRSVINWYIDQTDDSKLRSPFRKRHLQILRLRPATQKARKNMYDEELRAWFSELKKDNFLFYAMAVVQVNQVFRVSEVSAMKWSNLSLGHREYTVTEHIIWPRVNGAPPEILPGTKTSKAGQSFKSFLQQESVQVLKELLELGKNGDLIFTTDGSALTYRRIQHAYDRAFKRAALPFRGTHVCRHSGATNFLEKTGDVLALQQMGNWTNHKMALHYAKINSSRAREAILKSEKKLVDLKLVTDSDAS